MFIYDLYCTQDVTLVIHRQFIKRITPLLMLHTHNIVTNRVMQSKYFKIIDLIVSNWHTGCFASQADWFINSET